MMTLDSLLMGPNSPLSPSSSNNPDREHVLALAALALFDLSVITPLSGDHTTGFMLSKEAMKGEFLPKQTHNTIITAPFTFPCSHIRKVCKILESSRWNV